MPRILAFIRKLALKYCAAILSITVLLQPLAYSLPSSARSNPVTYNLSPQSVFQPMRAAGIRDTTELSFDLLCGTRMLLKGNSLAEVNNELSEINFLNVETRESKEQRLEASFIVLKPDKEKIKFQITYTDKTKSYKTDDLTKYAGVFKTGDEITVKLLEPSVKKERPEDDEGRLAPRGSPASFFNVIYEKFRYGRHKLSSIRKVVGMAESTANADTNRLASAGLIRKTGYGDSAIIEAILKDVDDEVLADIYNALIAVGTKPTIENTRSAVRSVSLPDGKAFYDVFPLDPAQADRKTAAVRHRYIGKTGTKDMIERVREAVRIDKPHIIRLYENLANLTQAERAYLEREIYNLRATYLPIWGVSSILLKDRYPEFKGQFFCVLRAVFPDIKLNPLGFRLNWSNKEAIMDSVGYVLSREIPGIMKRYEEIDTMTEAEKEQLRREVYGMNAANFRAWGLHRVLDREAAAYFYGKYSEVLKAVFEKLELSTYGFFCDWSTRETAVASIRFVLHREIPQIVQQYERRAYLSEAELRQLKEDIYAIKSGHFKVWKISSALRRKNAPYFNGTHIDALLAVFAGLDLDRLGFELVWSSEEQALASVRSALKRHVPHIMQDYERIEALNRDSLLKLRKAIYDITPEHFYAWGLGTALDKRWNPWFEKDYIKILQAVFHHPYLPCRRSAFINARKKQRKRRFVWTGEGAVVKNVRAVIAQDMPDIIERYDNYDALTDKQKEALTRDICKIKRKHFKLWGIDRLFTKGAFPQFKGHYGKILAHVFPKIKLNLLRFYHDWSTKDRAIESVRFALSLEAPHIWQRYKDLDNLNPAEIGLLSQDVYAITAGHFYLWRLGKVFGQKRMSYFKGSHIEALLAALENLDLNPLGFGLKWSTEDEAKGSIRYVLERAAPDIMRDYGRLGELTETEKEDLRNRIYEINKGQCEIWGLSSLHQKKSVPYYEGNYARTLVAIFEGLELNRMGFRLDWSTRDSAIASIRYVLSRERPALMKQYTKLERATMRVARQQEDELEVLRQEIYRFSRRHIDAWGLGELLVKKDVPHFNGSAIEALLAVFDHRLLNLEPEGFMGRAPQAVMISTCLPDDIAREYLPLMEEVSARAASYDEDPLKYLSGAMIGLKETYEKYPTTHPGFRALARTRMNKRILDQKREEGVLSRYTIAGLKSLNDAEEILWRKGNRNPTIAELAEVSGISDVEKVHNLIGLQKGITFISQLSPKGEGASVAEGILHDSEEPLQKREALIGQLVEEILEQHGKMLTSRERHIIMRYHFDPEKPIMVELAEDLGVSEALISILYHAGIDKIKTSIAAGGSVRSAAPGSPANFFGVIYGKFRYKNPTLKEIREAIGVAESTADRDTNRLASAGLIKKEGKGDAAIIDATLRDADSLVIEALSRALDSLGPKPKEGEIQFVTSRVVKACDGTIEAEFGVDGVLYNILLPDTVIERRLVMHEFLRNKEQNLAFLIEKIIFETVGKISFLDLVKKVRGALWGDFGGFEDAIYPDLKESIRAWLPKDYVERAKKGIKVTSYLIRRDHASMSKLEEEVELFNLPRGRRWTRQDYATKIDSYRRRVGKVVLNENEDQILGGMVQHLYDKSVRIIRFIVPPSSRSLNVELTILNDLIAKLGKGPWKQRRKIFIDVSEDNEHLLKLLLKRGFVVHRRIDSGWADGVDTYRMRYSKGVIASEVPAGSPANFFDVIYKHFGEGKHALREVRELVDISEAIADRDTNRLASAGLIVKEGKGDSATMEAAIRDVDDETLEALHQRLAELGTKPRVSQIQGAVEETAETYGGVIKVRPERGRGTMFSLKLPAEKLEYEGMLRRLGDGAKQYERRGDSLILYADDILRDTVMTDIEDTLGKLATHNLLRGGKIVLFAREEANAKILESMIEKASADLGKNVVIITQKELRERKAKAKDSKITEAEMLIELARANGAGNILGLIKGPPASQDIKRKELAAFSGLKIPVIIVGSQRALYSFAQAILEAIDIKNQGGKGGWLAILPSIKPITDAIEGQYKAYLLSLEAAIAA